MRNRKTRIIMGILVGLIMFSSSIALLMYTKQNDLSRYVEKHIDVYTASKNIRKGDKITATDLVKSSLPKSYLAFTPLTQSEIVGRYAKVEIYKKEPFRREKISSQKPTQKKRTPLKIVKKEVKQVVEKKNDGDNDTITISLNMFKNIDGSLKKGDHIDIVSVILNNSRLKNNNYTTKYIALNVPIFSFVSNGVSVKDYLHQGKKGVIKADSMILEMVPREIKNFLATYYKTQAMNGNRTRDGRGHLWMVKCNEIQNNAEQDIKKKMLVDHRAIVYKRKKAARKVSISYEN